MQIAYEKGVSSSLYMTRSSSQPTIRYPPIYHEQNTYGIPPVQNHLKSVSIPKLKKKKVIKIISASHNVLKEYHQVTRLNNQYQQIMKNKRAKSRKDKYLKQNQQLLIGVSVLRKQINRSLSLDYFSKNHLYKNRLQKVQVKKIVIKYPLTLFDTKQSMQQCAIKTTKPNKFKDCQQSSILNELQQQFYQSIKDNLA